MRLLLCNLLFLLLGACCLLLTGIAAQGFNPSRAVNEVPIPFHNQFRRQLSTQQHILTDVHHHTQQRQTQQQQQQQQQYFLQQAPSVEVPIQTQQQRNRQVAPTVNTRFPPSGNGRGNYVNNQNANNNINNINNNEQYQQNSVFQRSTQNQLYTPQQPIRFQQPQQQQQPLQQQQNVDQHTQNFLTLRNFGNQQVGPQQSLPQRSYNNKPFQSQATQPQQPLQQPLYSTLPNSIYKQQPQQSQQAGPSNFGLPQTQQKLPSSLPIPTFQTQSVAQAPLKAAFSTTPQLIFQQQQQQQQQPQLLLLPQQQQQQQHTNYQQLPLQQQQNGAFQLTPNLGLPVPQIFPNLQSTAFPSAAPQPQQQPQQQFVNPQFATLPTPQAQSADQEYKQKIIQKHEQFVQKQYEKSQNKVRQQHEEFLAKQQTLKQQLAPTLQLPLQQQQQQLQQQQQQYQNYQPPRSRPLAPSELHLFSSALQKYHEEHPTTTTTTTTTTTEATTAPSKQNSKNVYAQVKAELGKYGMKTTPGKKPVKTIGRDELLKQLKAALAEAPQKEDDNKTYSEMDLVLPNGQRVQVIRTTDPNLVKGQQALSQDQLQSLLAQQGISAPEVVSAPAGGKLSISDVAPESAKDLVLPNGSKVQISRSPVPEAAINPQALPGGVDLSNLASLYGGDIEGISSGANSIASSAVIQSDSDEPPTLEELAKRGLIPDGYEIEGLSSNKPAPAPQPVPTLPPKKKATYVYLEEQADGSFKIQGVKANGEKETKQTGAEVESILERIRSGEIKLPPSVSRLTLPNDEVVEIQGGNIIKITATSTTTPRTTTTTSTTTTTTTTTEFPFARTSPIRHQYHSTRTSPYVFPSTTYAPLVHRTSPAEVSLAPPAPESTATTYYTTPAPIYTASTAPAVYETSTPFAVTERLVDTVPESGHYTDTLVQETENNEKAAEVTSTNPSEDLIQILKSNGLFAMAKYLRQSGLDSILNETGPYTIFVPTDKAFKNLLVQLGGPERAEEKFKANPRLLSGLLLHHVIPGAFEIATLQDEMTGVSLAGTQLRVNQYTMHDQEWNDVTITTINGAMVLLNKKDIKIPQGVAHAVDRVMFPLPVGDLLQTLQSDRENRFSNFLKILYTSGLSEKLQSKGIKTYTVFAPVDKSFRDMESDTLDKLFNDKDAAEEFAMKHIVPGSLFSAGMRFYQVKDSLQTGKTVILQKTSAGKIKVNDAQMVTSNIPATNGVIHALDGVLA
ncbi:PREDICTED: probable serine/threonine-protein kinase kinX [Bactrocera latifrons]|nr:PREDICTED: probable serine/threonine-protein kinase kinX [Bactrocera latifrons]